MPLFDPAQLQQYAQQIAVQPQAKPGIGAAPYLALFGGEGADIASTLYALHHGGEEANSALGDFGPKAIAAKLALSVPLALWMRHLAKTGHPTLAKTLGYASGAGLGAVAAHNVAVAK